MTSVAYWGVEDTHGDFGDIQDAFRSAKIVILRGTENLPPASRQHPTRVPACDYADQNGLPLVARSANVNLADGSGTQRRMNEQIQRTERDS